METKYLEVKVVKDESGHTYTIPVEWETEFDEYVEKSEQDFPDDEDSDEFSDFVNRLDYLENKFYNLMYTPTLYMKVKED